MIIWMTLESAEVLGRRKVYFCFYYKIKNFGGLFVWFFFPQSPISYLVQAG